MKVVLITGASSGIGEATAEFLSKSGYIVYAGMRDPDNYNGCLLTVQKTYQNLYIAYHDVNCEHTSQSLIEDIIERHGHLDILVNNAGIGTAGAVEETPLSAFREVFETNFFAVTRLIQQVTPHMREQRAGTIINVSSIAGLMADAGLSAYSCSKFALEALTESLALEVKRFNIRVALIEPGIVDTRIYHSDPASKPQQSTSAYDRLMKQRSLMITKRLLSACPPIAVATTIKDAIETQAPKLRYLVGKETAKWLDARNKLTNEQWLEFGDELSDSEFQDLYAQYFKLKI